jgi:hypothetical protein
MNGLTVYCETHDQGAIIIDKNNDYKLVFIYDHIGDPNLNKICGGNKLLRKCCWIKHGECNVVNDIISFTSLNKSNYERLNGGWIIDYFKKNVYDSDMNLLDYSEGNIKWLEKL